MSACSDTDDPGTYPPGRPGSGQLNIVEKSAYSGNIDWLTYVGDDFYRYATGAWQDATNLGNSSVKGTQDLQDDLSEAFVNKVCTESGCPLLQRLFTQYKGTEDRLADIEKVRNKLNTIASEVTGKEQAWMKMAELLKEGYAMPFDYSVDTKERNIYSSLTSNTDAIKTTQADMKDFVSEAECREIMAGARRVWISAGTYNDDDSKRNTKSHNCIKEPMRLLGRSDNYL